MELIKYKEKEFKIYYLTYSYQTKISPNED